MRGKSDEFAEQGYPGRYKLNTAEVELIGGCLISIPLMSTFCHIGIAKMTGPIGILEEKNQ